MKLFLSGLGLMCLGVFWVSAARADATLTTPTLQGSVTVQSWKDRRDAQIVKQDLDYSCGAASLATILNGFYGKTVTEDEILKAMNKEDGMASFSDMAAVLPRLVTSEGRQGDFKGVGLALSFAQLQKIKVPAIVYLRYRGDDHFSVLRGISEDTVWLGDPSWGNRRLSTQQFLQMWETRDDAEYKGKVLLVLPTALHGPQEQPAATPTQDTFFRPPIPNILAIELLGIRQF